MYAVKSALNINSGDGEGVSGNDDSEKYGGFSFNTVDSLINNAKVGESVIVNLEIEGDNGEKIGHYITVTKQENGNYSVEDPNVRNGKAVQYNEEGLRNVLNGQDGVDAKGNKTGAKYFIKEDGNINVVSAKTAVDSLAGVNEISDDNLKQIGGAGLFSFISKAVNTLKGVVGEDDAHGLRYSVG